MRRTTAALVIFGIGALAGCSSTTAGHPVSVGPAPANRSVATSTSTPSPTPTGSTPAAPAGAALSDPDRVSTMLAAANGRLTHINDYDYRNVKDPAYRVYVLRNVTGPLRARLAQTLTTIIENAPRQHAYQTTAVLHSGVADLHGNEATVVIFGQLTLHNTSLPKGRTDPFAATVGVTLVRGQWLISRLEVNGAATCDPPGNADLVTACRAAADGVAAVTTLHRATFDRDYARAAAKLTDPLRSEFQAKKASTLRAMRAGGYDVRGDVVSAAVELVKPTQVLVLISLNGYQSGDSNPVSQHLRATVKKVGGRWLLADVQTA